ncbi:MAG TPA: ribbon-helix-helix protein, CopG family [Jiangellaceae bacterium]|nr:ribbon-helix-helix protein, CopG family [Jiangellaceae bacterium]
MAIKLSEQGIEHIDQRAAAETAGNRSEMIRRMLAFAAQKMPKGWKP